MAGKIPASGFKSPAPVLPAMGLHSFHNDSPPFAPASQHAKSGEPDHLSLDSPLRESNSNSDSNASTSNHGNQPNHSNHDNTNSTPNAHPNSSPLSPGHLPSLNNADPPLAQPVPIRQKGFDPNTALDSTADQGQSNVTRQTRPPNIRLPTSSADDALSTSRSRRLLSGYMFGNPPTPYESVPSSPTKGGSISQSLLNPPSKDIGGSALEIEEIAGSGEKIPGYDNPPPPSQTRDSTPVSTVSSSPEPESRISSAPVPPIESSHNDAVGDLARQMQASSIDLPEEVPKLSSSAGTVGTIGTVNEQIKMSDKEKAKEKAANEEMRRRRMSRVRDKEIGYDALTGLSDGEADADDSAPQAVFGTRQYLLGTEGEAGEYRFPRHRLRTKMKDESKIPLVIVACGSFSPPTYLHLRMFEMAKDEVLESQTYEIMAGYYSPVSSYYKKSGLAPAIHRVRMCELAVEHTSTWLMVDPWEAGQPEYTRTAVVLEHFNEMLNVQGGGLTMSDGKRRKYKIMLLAGGDLIESFGEPGVWSEPDLHIILGRFGCLIVERAGSDVWAFLLSHDILYHHRRNVIVIKQLIYNDISSTKVRLFVKRGMSIKYLLPNSVIQYIYDNKLYR